MSTTLAKGHKQVRELEASLGGRPPAAVISRSKAALTQYVRDYFDRQNAERRQFEKVIAKSRDRVLSLLPKDDPGIKKEIAEAKSFYKARAERRLAKPKREKVESQFVVGSQFVLKGQPFDAEWTFGSVAHANKNDGTYDVAVQSIGDGSLQTAAGVGAWFWSTEADVQKRFAVLLDYDHLFGFGLRSTYLMVFKSYYNSVNKNKIYRRICANIYLSYCFFCYSFRNNY